MADIGVTVEETVIGVTVEGGGVVSGGGGAPSGPAGGDLAGNYPNPQLAAGVIVDNDISPNAAIAQSKIWNLGSTLDDKASAGHTHPADPTQIPKSLVDAKGDLIVGSANDAVARLPTGAAGQVLTVNSAAAYGVEWAAPSAAGSVDEVLPLPVGAPVPPGTPTGTLIVRYQ